MSNKTPFEVRLEVLKMAQNMVSIAYQDANSLAWEMLNRVAEYQDKSIADMQEYLSKIRQPTFTPADIIKKAEELYSFIEKKD